MPAPPSDEQLLAEFASGRDAALGVLADRHERALVGLACGLLRGREDLARDAVQDAWLRVIKSARWFDASSSFKTWMYRIVINRCHDIRATHRPPPLGEAAGPREAAHSVTRAEAAERLALLHRLVEELPESERLAVVLCHHEGLTHAEAAAVLGLPLGTLKSRLYAGVTSLRARLPREVEA